MYLVLFLLTLVTTTASGMVHWTSFVSDFGRIEPQFTTLGLVWNGFWYSLSVLLILGAHEFGHYFACRFYNVNASLPYFIPSPFLFGTFGAVIRIRQPIATKRQFFDIGIAGPIAGFVMLIPVLIFAMRSSSVVQLPASFQGYEFGEPLLFKLVTRLVFGVIPEHASVNLHPAGWAAWVGMLATALNLAPVGQFDGGHISYAVFGRHSSTITIAATLLMIALPIVSISYLVPAVMVVLMVLSLGPHHPRTADESEPLDPARLALAAFAAVMFVLCFTPVPIEMVGF
jgi:membrane-associated protease RseP (regulator of RpoE activity)